MVVGIDTSESLSNWYVLSFVIFIVLVALHGSASVRIADVGSPVLVDACYLVLNLEGFISNQINYLF